MIGVLIWIVLLVNQEDCHKVNLALDKKAYLDSVLWPYYARNGVDGKANTFAHSDTVVDSGWFVVDLGRPYQVEYIVFYHRSDCCQKRMDNFIVGLSNNFDSKINRTISRDYKFCIRDGGTASLGGKTKIDCENKDLYSRYVIVQQKIGKSALTVPEIEIFGEYIYYVGCFKTLENIKIIESNINLKECINTCDKHYYRFAAMQATSCFCGNSTRNAFPLSACDSKCPGEVDFCGSSNKFSVYTGYSGAESNLFKSNHHCKDNSSLNSDGICTNGLCKDGWIGDDCTIRNCSAHNGDCGKHICQITNVNGGVYSECICNNGYDKTFWWDYCQDIDECKENKCNSTIFGCINTEGSYTCSCLSGLKPRDNLLCEDIDECETSEHKCDISTTTCLNTFGSFSCKCKEGFTNESSYKCRDVNECTEMPSMCNSTISNCTNTPGSYECLCFEDLLYDKLSNTCVKPHPEETKKAIILSVVCVVLGIFIILGFILSLIYRRRVLNRFQKFSSKNESLVREINTEKGEFPTASSLLEFQRSSKIDADYVFWSESVPLSQLNDYFQENKVRLTKAFEVIPQVSGDSTSYAQQVGLKSKNKFKNIMPFDKNRVTLRSLPNANFSDYINASFVPNIGATFQFIAAQGPIKDTEYDFLRMIVENKVEIIVMLTNCVEDGKIKCVQYWPNEGSKDVDDINISVEEAKIWSTHEIRKLVITQNSVSHVVYHMLYTQWFDHKAPDNVGSIINFHNSMERLDRINQNSPILVHCSAGVGRTGTFIAIDHLLHEAQRTQEVDVLKCVQFLRSQRNHMIQTKNQFMFCFDALILYHELGSTTAIKVEDGTNVEQMLSERKHLINKEYEMISKLGLSHDDSSIRNGESSNVFHIPGCVRNSSYELNVTDKISWKDVVGRCTDDKMAIIVVIDEDIDEKLKSLPFQNHHGKLAVTSRFSDLSVHHIEFFTDDSSDHVYTNTENTNILAIASDTSQELNALWNVIKEFQYTEKSLVICTDNISKAGFVACALNLLEMKEELGEIDVYQVVYQMKSVAPQIIESLELYRRLYMFVESMFSDPQEIYVNSAYM